jgi:hypothetical protein
VGGRAPRPPGGGGPRARARARSARHPVSKTNARYMVEKKGVALAAKRTVAPLSPTSTSILSVGLSAIKCGGRK